MLRDVAIFARPDAAVGGEGFVDEAEFLRTAESRATTGEAGWTTLERLWVRPTAEVNGMWGGYTGPGHKTIVPSDAHA